MRKLTRLQKERLLHAAGAVAAGIAIYGFLIEALTKCGCSRCQKLDAETQGDLERLIRTVERGEPCDG